MKNNQDYQLLTSLIVTLVTISATSTPGPERLSADDDSFHRQDAEATTSLNPKTLCPPSSCRVHRVLGSAVWTHITVCFGYHPHLYS
jgi:hypothetical protein